MSAGARIPLADARAVADELVTILGLGCAERFWAKVNMTPTVSGCLEWIGSRPRGPKAYGRFFDGERVRDAHRVALEMALGRSLRPGMLACHACNNRWCVRAWPGHLYEGNRADNAADAIRSGCLPSGDRHYSRQRPQPRGEAAHNVVLTSGAVQEIRSSYDAGKSQRALSRRFGVNRSTIGRIVRRETWA